MNKDEQKQIIKQIIKSLHNGKDVDNLKAKFENVIRGLDEEDILKIEEELIKEGMPPDEVRRLCSLHLQLFENTLRKERIPAPEGHPIFILMEEHRFLSEISEKLVGIAEKIKNNPALVDSEMDTMSHIIDHLKDSEKHYLREENVLFPYLEKHGITEPPKIMWAEHTKIREKKKEIYTLYEKRNELPIADFTQKLPIASNHLKEMLSDHFFKENNILFPAAMKVLDKIEWNEIVNGFNEIGYCCFTPGTSKSGNVKESEHVHKESAIQFETGEFTLEELGSLLDTLPIDITFVDAEDTVRYFNQSKHRIFVRTKAVIGRKVQNCHPQKSIHIVNKILDDFRHDRRDTADFWINYKGRLIYIRYLAVRKEGKYLGTLEVTQDITDIQNIKGEKRLLD